MLLDAIVDGYFPIVDQISDRIEDLESLIFDHYRREVQEQIFALKKDLLAVRRVLAPERDMMNVLLRPGSPVFGEATVAYFQDVYDHILRIMDAVDTDRDLLSSALDAFLSVTSNRLNQTMKTLTASSIILMTMTLVAGVYGMNFVHMPELDWKLGYAWALGVMVALGAGLIVVFRRIDWI
jgi:magnesium transporter